VKEAAHLPYADRREAGRVLAAALEHLRHRPGLIVLALPRGGVAVGYEVAQALHAPLDVIIVRKLGFPGHEEYAMGAIASGGVRVMNPMPGLHVRAEEIERVAAAESLELQRREKLYRGDAPPLKLAGHTVVIVDDGLATGATMRAAAMAMRQQQPAHLCVAAPVGAPETCHAMLDVADEVVCPAQPLAFRAVGLWYRYFPQSTDEEVRELLDQSRAHQP